MNTTPLNLGPGPSVLGDDPASRVQRDAGYQVSDFHGAFTPGAVFQPTRTFVALGPLDVVHAGAVAVQGALAVFDPGRHFPRQSVQPFLRELPSGRHDVFLCVRKSSAGVLASCVRFRDEPVARWTPALFHPSCPRPPLLPMFTISSVVGFSDAAAASADLGDADDDDNPDDEPIEWSRVGDQEVLARGGVVGFSVGGAGSYASWFGEDADGSVVALATEYGMLRILTTDTADVPVAAAVKKSVRLDGRNVVVSAAMDSKGTSVSVRASDPLEAPEDVVLQDAEGKKHRASRTSSSSGITMYTFGVTGVTIRLDFTGISVPRLRLDVAAVQSLLEGWRTRDLIAVDAAHLHTLAERFVSGAECKDVRSWLMEQDEVEEVFF